MVKPLLLANLNDIAQSRLDVIEIDEIAAKLVLKIGLKVQVEN